MENRFNEITEGRWVEDKMSRLEPSAEWQPDMEKAFQRLSQREQTRGTPRWARLSMAAALSAIVLGVVFALPWQVLWKSVTPPAAKPTATNNVDSVAGQQPVAPIRIPSLSVPAPITSEPLREQTNHLVIQREWGGIAEGPEPGIAPPPPPPPPPPPGVHQPVVVSQLARPAYTEEARAAKITGTIELRVLIRTDGTSQVLEVTKSLGFGLDESAVAAVEQWRYAPATKDGEPVEVLTTVTVNFSLR